MTAAMITLNVWRENDQLVYTRLINPAKERLPIINIDADGCLWLPGVGAFIKPPFKVEFRIGDHDDRFCRPGPD